MLQENGGRWPVVNEELGRIPELERELRASKERVAKLEKESQEQREATRQTVAAMNEKLDLWETRLQEQGMPQSGQTPWGIKLRRLQVWVQALNGGIPPSIDPVGCTNPITGLEKSQRKLSQQQERLQSELETLLTQPTQTQAGRSANEDAQSIFQALDPIQSNWLQSSRNQSNGVQSNRIHSSRNQSDPIQSTPMDSNLMESHSMGSNPMELNHISFNRDGPNAMPSNPIQSSPRDSNPMPSNGLSAGRLNGNPASTSPIDQLNPTGTQAHPVLLVQD